MPYDWTTSDPAAPVRELHLWPHQSLPPRGRAAFILATFALILLPLGPLLGTGALWGVLPFLLLAVAGIWLALERSHRDAQILEILTLTPAHARLVRHDTGAPPRQWDCNRHWARATLHDTDGPVPHYVTLSGGGREVEIGAFLTEEERIALYGDLMRCL